MINLPANLGQRILDAARIAAAMHEQTLRDQLVTLESAGGAGHAVIDHDGNQTPQDGSPASRLRRWWSRLR